jgi:urate oxidase
LPSVMRKCPKLSSIVVEAPNDDWNTDIKSFEHECQSINLLTKQ